MRVRSIAHAAAAIRGRRLDMGLSQAELAARSGVSRRWISQFEAGKARAEFALVLRVLDELGLAIELVDADVVISHGTDAAASNGLAAEPPVDLDELLEEYRQR